MVLLSGGADSVISVYWAKNRYDEVYAITFDYMQRNNVEIKSAEKIAKLANVKNHKILKIGNILKSCAPLNNQNIKLEEYSDYNRMMKDLGSNVEVNFIPMRNDLFLTLAINHALYHDIYHIVIGSTLIDGVNCPDCRYSFISAKIQSSNFALGTESSDNGINIVAPLMNSSKAETIRTALSLVGCYSALGYSHTSYSSEYPPIKDHATVLRDHGFEEANLPDPAIVRAYWEGKIKLPATPNYQKYLSIILPNKHIPEDNIYNELLAFEDKLRETFYR
jgi:7-cyano-7-deazaguanine synthase